VLKVPFIEGEVKEIEEADLCDALEEIGFGEETSIN